MQANVWFMHIPQQTKVHNTKWAELGSNKQGSDKQSFDSVHCTSLI